MVPPPPRAFFQKHMESTATDAVKDVGAGLKLDTYILISVILRDQ